jgi:hypothetical protein
VKSRLPGSNGYVAAYNPVVTFCTGSHNNTIMLGSTEAAKSAMFYLIPYQGKVKFDFQQTLSILDSQLRQTEQYPSVADDSGTPQCTVKHLLTATLN